MQKNTTITKEDFWGLQGSESEAEYKKKMKDLQNKNPNAAKYLTDIGPENWVVYAIVKKFNCTLHGHRTNGVVESANNTFNAIRELSPLNAIQSIMIYVSMLITRRRDEIKKVDNNDVFTPYFSKIMNGQVQLLTNYAATKMSDNASDQRACVQWRNDVDKMYNVDLRDSAIDKPCSCLFRQNNGIDCVHTLQAMKLYKTFTMGEYATSNRCPAYALLQQYSEAYSQASVIVPLLSDIAPKDISVDIETSTPADPSAILPPLYRRTAKLGRPKTTRIPNAGSGADSKRSNHQVQVDLLFAQVENERVRRNNAGQNRHREQD